MHSRAAHRYPAPPRIEAAAATTPGSRLKPRGVRIMQCPQPAIQLIRTKSRATQQLQERPREACACYMPARIHVSPSSHRWTSPPQPPQPPTPERVVPSRAKVTTSTGVGCRLPAARGNCCCPRWVHTASKNEAAATPCSRSPQARGVAPRESPPPPPRRRPRPPPLLEDASRHGLLHRSTIEPVNIR
jgi:hypothetical protein